MLHLARARQTQRGAAERRGIGTLRAAPLKHERGRGQHSLGGGLREAFGTSETRLATQRLCNVSARMGAAIC